MRGSASAQASDSDAEAAASEGGEAAAAAADGGLAAAELRQRGDEPRHCSAATAATALAAEGERAWALCSPAKPKRADRALVGVAGRVRARNVRFQSYRGARRAGAGMGRSNAQASADFAKPEALMMVRRSQKSARSTIR